LYISNIAPIFKFFNRGIFVKLEYLNDIKTALFEEFSNRFKGIVLFGSESTGRSFADSDIDIMVLLEGPLDLGKDLDRIIISTYFIQMKISRQLHFIPADYLKYSKSESSFYKTVQREGVPIV
jgi:predicted nucleotidyltransferase